MAPTPPKAASRAAHSAVVRDADGTVLLATATYCTSGDELLSALRDLLVVERRHDTFRPTNVPSGAGDGLERGDLGPVREAVRAGRDLTVDLRAHPGWSPAADAARSVDGALAVWTGRTDWADEAIAPAPIRIAKRHTTCEACGASPTRVALRERICQGCGADLPRPGRA